MDRRAQWAEERILGDERLRGDLTDDQFEQILRWALPLARQAARATAAIEDFSEAESALDDGLRDLRREIREAVRQAEEGLAAVTEPPSTGEPEPLAQPDPAEIEPISGGSVSGVEDPEEQAAHPAGFLGLPPIDLARRLANELFGQEPERS